MSTRSVQIEFKHSVWRALGDHSSGAVTRDNLHAASWTHVFGGIYLEAFLKCLLDFTKMKKHSKSNNNMCWSSYIVVYHDQIQYILNVLKELREAL